MIIRWIKTIVQITLDNSFCVASGMCRILRNYNTRQTRDIYELVLQDPDRGKDDDQYREVKGRLINRLVARFGGQVRTANGHRGDRHFEVQKDQDRHRNLVSKCLRRLAPWDADAVKLPDRFDPTRDTVAQLRFTGEHPDEERYTEARRIATLIEPSSLARLAEALSLSAPEERLAIPEFFLAGKGGGRRDERGDRWENPVLAPREKQSIRDIVSERSAIRESFAPRSVVVTVDGVERATINLERASDVQFAVGDEDELVEVWGRAAGGEVLMAATLLSRDAEQRCPAVELETILEGGQHVAFSVSTSDVRVSYRETKPLDTTMQKVQRNVERKKRLVGELFEASFTIPRPAMVHRIRLETDAVEEARGCPLCEGTMRAEATDAGPHGSFEWKCDSCPFCFTINHRS